jgi:hypothetical protein
MLKLVRYQMAARGICSARTYEQPTQAMMQESQLPFKTLQRLAMGCTTFAHAQFRQCNLSLRTVQLLTPHYPSVRR